MKNKTKNPCSHPHAWHDGGCCCNCIHQKELMKHPWNKGEGKGSITERMGFICTVELEENPKRKKAIYYQTEHGFCELYWPNEPTETTTTVHIDSSNNDDIDFDLRNL